MEREAGITLLRSRSWGPRRPVLPGSRMESRSREAGRELLFSLGAQACECLMRGAGPSSPRPRITLRHKLTLFLPGAVAVTFVDVT